jgi:glutathione S-transferase
MRGVRSSAFFKQDLYMLIVHHLNFSRSSRVLWLVEELQVPYQIKRYERDSNFRAPAALKKIHPFGKAPVIQDGDLMLAESATVLTYINERHGEGRLSPPVGTDAAYVHDEWLQFVESSAGLSIMSTAIGGLIGGLSEGFAGWMSAEVNVSLKYISDRVAQRTFLMGDELTLADVQMSYMLLTAQNVGLLADYPQVATYLSRLEARPAYMKAVAIGGPMWPPTT